MNGNDETVFEGEVFLIGETVDGKSNTVNVHVQCKLLSCFDTNSLLKEACMWRVILVCVCFCNYVLSEYRIILHVY